jgi:hypothetical protein
VYKENVKTMLESKNALLKVKERGETRGKSK